MNILQVIPYINPKRGGDVNICFNISKNLAHLGHSVTIITTDFDFDTNFSKKIKKLGIQIIPFHCLFNFSLFLYSPDMKKWLKKNITNFDILYLHDFRTYQNIICYEICSNNKLGFILQAHGDIPYFGKIYLKWIFDILWGRKILRNAISVIALSKSEELHYIEKGVNKNRVCIVPNGIDFSEFSNSLNMNSFKEKYHIEKNTKIILYIGRIHESKGIDLLIKSFAILNKNYYDLKLVIIGPNYGYKAKLLELANDFGITEKLLILDYISHEDKKSALLAGTVFVTPSYLGFPVTFLEACAMGLPLVTTNKFDNLEWINNNVGFVVNYNERDIANAINKIISNEKLAKIFRENGKNIIKNDFDWPIVMNKIQNILIDAINK